jgi:AraC-like DNA-binding protein
MALCILHEDRASFMNVKIRSCQQCIEDYNKNNKTTQYYFIDEEHFTCPYKSKANLLKNYTCSTCHFKDTAGALSIKCVLRGNETYEIGKNKFVVDNEHFLIINGGESYYSYIESEGETEGFCVFFDDEFVGDVYGTIANSSEAQLVDIKSGTTDVVFPEKTFSHNMDLSPHIWQLHSAFTKDVSHIGVEETLYMLLEKLIKNFTFGNYNEDLNSLRNNVKKEIYRQLNKAKSFIDSNFTYHVNLNLIAGEAILSKYHFLRLFKQVFGVTPGQYLIEKRLNYAKYLIIRTKKPITDICYISGFENLSYFSRCFRKRFGISPSDLRDANLIVDTKIAK